MSPEGNAKNSGTAVDFHALILGFSSAALYYLGENVVEGRKADKSLPLARQNIDIILLLKEKTKGNLTDEESRLLEQVLTDLQLKFVEATK